MTAHFHSVFTHKDGSFRLVRDELGAVIPHFKHPYPRRYSITHGGRNRRLREQYLCMRMQRPIQGFLVTHRRRFTTGNKHKQPYQG